MKPGTVEIEKVIFSHFGEEVLNIHSIEEGVMTYKFQFQIGETEYMIRIYPNERSEIADREVRVLTLALNKACKVPKVFYSGKIENMSYLIYQKLPGLNLSKVYASMSNNQKDHIIEQIVTNYCNLSNIVMPQFGDMMAEKYAESWLLFVKKIIQENVKYLNGNLFFDSLSEKQILFEMERVMKGKTFIPSLVWLDFSRENIIVDNGQLSGFVDFESCVAGDPLMGLGYILAREGLSDFYIEVKKKISGKFDVDEELVIFYAFFRILRILKYSHQALPNGVSRDNLEDYFKGINIILKTLSLS